MMLMVIGGYYMTMRKVGEEPHVECLKYDNSVSAWEILHYPPFTGIYSTLYPCSTKTREVLGNPIPMPEGRGKS